MDTAEKVTDNIPTKTYIQRPDTEILGEAYEIWKLGCRISTASDTLQLQLLVYLNTVSNNNET